jgi:hypothetical protein
MRDEGKEAFLAPFFFYPKLCLHLYSQEEQSHFPVGPQLPHPQWPPLPHCRGTLDMATEGKERPRITANPVTSGTIL